MAIARSVRGALTLLLAMLLMGAARAPAAQVVVLSTLHKLHGEVPGYGFDELRRTIERLAPDVLCLEVQAGDLDARPPEQTKQEYPRVVYPLLDAHGWRAYPLEPSEPASSALIKPYVAANREFAVREPERARALGEYGDGVYAGLRAYWTSPARVNDAVTDASMRAKHALQQAMVGPGEQAGWQAWNAHFLEVVSRAARENPGKRIVVLVGAEHGYWLREHLAAVEGIEVLDTAALLARESQR